MTLLVPLVIFASAQSTVTVTIPPSPMPKALKILSQATGKNLTAAATFSEEVVLARLENAPVDLTLSHLAEVFCAKWQSQPNGSLQLVRDPVALRSFEAEESAKATNTLIGSLSYLEKRLAQQPPIA